ncbi:MAG TPA: low-specificity L-threonine aldolase [Firmicutes bacterium]|nr:low-specificity L-threonine aldolase [Bacillota bacterium]HBG45349.1 low-specificity L-threonine aldolase [Bacillota bacterium]HBL69572.1 low-specificity L-threonine aldolase [Bacillota bacterium]HBR24053.1 low-specificity L-threonine aldolase [Bacillota bacterium]HCF93221.1 low-specificity L-threonine aldolase [Bacillota bacterium]
MYDLRSDTVTKPTPEMRQAMAEAEVGDDVYGEDPTVHELETLGAELVGQEAALFVPSGTMGNQVAILTHTHRGDEIIAESNAHIVYYEVGGCAVLSGVQLRTIPGRNGYMEPTAIEEAIRGADVHFPESRLLCLENTHNRSGGTVVSPEAMERMIQAAHGKGLRVHLDGARIFNAAAALGVKADKLTRSCDSVMFCLSKGLAAPVGSLLAGSAEFIVRARKYRKMLGGGMRQAGILAAAGIIALQKMIGRLGEDHHNAAALAQGIAGINGLSIDLSSVQTNMVVFDISGLRTTMESFLNQLAEAGVLAGPVGSSKVRMVTHKDISATDIPTVIQIINKISARTIIGQRSH